VLVGRTDPLLEALRRLPPGGVAGGLVLLQLVALGGLARTGHWGSSAGHAALGAVLVSVQVVLVYLVGIVVAGRLFGLWAGLVFVAGPVLLLRYWTIGGNPSLDFGPVFHEQFLRAALGFEAAGAVAAGCLLLASGFLALAPTSRDLAAAVGAGAAAAGAAIAHPLAWPAVGAPVLARALARRPRAAAACLATVAVGLGVLALARYVPGMHPGWHTMGWSLDHFREWSWSRRLLEYLPLAGLVGLAIRNPPAAGFFGWLLLTVIVFPLGRPLELLPLLLAMVPGLPAYAFLTASLVLLVPRRRPAVAISRAPRAEASR
jgi:hypothetical protein